MNRSRVNLGNGAVKKTGVRKKMAGGGMVKKTGVKKRMRAGGMVKKPSKDQVGLKKLPKEVRNKMGYMAAGGAVAASMKAAKEIGKASKKLFDKRSSIKERDNKRSLEKINKKRS